MDSFLGCEEQSWKGGFFRQNANWVVSRCFKYFLCLTLLGEMIQFDKHMFQRGGSTTNYIASNLGMLNHIDRSRFICIDIQVIQFQRVGLLQ